MFHQIQKTTTKIVTISEDHLTGDDSGLEFGGWKESAGGCFMTISYSSSSCGWAVEQRYLGGAAAGGAEVRACKASCHTPPAPCEFCQKKLTVMQVRG